MSEGDWWYCLTEHQVEHGAGCPNAERLGPYATQAEAASAPARTAAASKAWDDNARWNDGPDRPQDPGAPQERAPQ